MARTPFKRTDRVASVVRQVLGELLTFEVKDPRVRGAVISDVEITGDLREARVFVIPPQDGAEASAMMDGLQRASGYLRRELGQRVELRVTPQLDFRYDRSIEYGNRIEQKLRELGLGDAHDDESDTLDESVDDDLDDAEDDIAGTADDLGDALDEALDDVDDALDDSADSLDDSADSLDDSLDDSADSLDDSADSLDDSADSLDESIDD